MTIAEYNKILEKQNRGKVAPSEHDLQAACVKWFRLIYPEYAHLLFAIPNGGQRNLLVAAKLKAEGVQAGIPDLMLAMPNTEYHGLFIEMKNGMSNRLTENQKKLMLELNNQGYRAVCARSMEDFEKEIKNYINMR